MFVVGSISLDVELLALDARVVRGAGTGGGGDLGVLTLVAGSVAAAVEDFAVTGVVSDAF